MRKVFWSPEEVPAPEFLRRLTVWLSDSSGKTFSLRRDLRYGLLRATLTQRGNDQNGEFELVRVFSTPVLEVDNALREVSRQGERVQVLGDQTCEPLEGQLSWDDIDKAPGEPPPEPF